MTTPFPFVAGTVLTAAELNAITNLPINDKTASYTLLASDAGKRVVMNVASANTVTVDDDIFGVGDTVFIANKGAGETTVTAGAGVTINTAGSLVIAQHGGGTLVATSASTFTFFPSGGGGVGYGVATGGTSDAETIDGINYTLLTFSSDDNLVVTKEGLFDVLLIGGGAAGSGNPLTRGSGGGGGGQVIGQTALVTVFLAEATYAVDVGAGGAGGLSGNGTSGKPSVIGTLLFACGGIAGTGSQSPTQVNGSTGGSRDAFTPTTTNASVNVNQGGGTNSDEAGGGGGGAGGAGGAGSGTTGGSGGDGLDISGFTGGSTFYAGAGGAGGAQTTGGAAGEGGVAGKTSGTGNSGVNTGAAGGGTFGSGTTGGNGAAGKVFVRFEV